MVTAKDKNRFERVDFRFAGQMLRSKYIADEVQLFLLLVVWTVSECPHVRSGHVRKTASGRRNTSLMGLLL